MAVLFRRCDYSFAVARAAERILMLRQLGNRAQRNNSPILRAMLRIVVFGRKCFVLGEKGQGAGDAVGGGIGFDDDFYVVSTIGWGVAGAFWRGQLGFLTAGRLPPCILRHLLHLS